MSDVSSEQTVSSSIRRDARLSVSKDMVARKNQDGTVIVMRLDDSAVFFKIDGIAASVWSEIANQPTTADLISRFQEKYPDHSSQVESDIVAFLNDLLGKKLITAN